jgi:hypothetical protein
MRIYFSGGGGLVDTPEVLLPDRKPHIMLTFHQISQKQTATTDRLKAYLKRKKNENKQRKLPS